MDPRVARLKTLEECANFLVNAKARGETALAQAARRRAIQLRAKKFGLTSPLEIECVEAVCAYEEVMFEERGRRQPATRTWQMLKRYGTVAAVEKIVAKKTESAGFHALARMGLLDLTFEAVVLRHPKSFNELAVEVSNLRLKAAAGGGQG